MTTRITAENITDATITTTDLATSVPLNTQWQAVHTADAGTPLAVVAGRGYFINTTSAVQTVTLPGSPSIGDTITIVDYASTFATNNVTVDPGSNKIEASTTDAALSTNDQTHTFVFTDSTQGWKIINQDTASGIQPTYISATGGTVTTSGDFKIHTFTGDGNFVVASIGNASGGGASSDYLVVAGGGSGGVRSPGNANGGGGAGGMRYSAATFTSPPCAPAHPRRSTTGIDLTAATFPITVGGGGAAVDPTPGGVAGNNGSNSVFSTITSTGGGKGGGGAGGIEDGGTGGSGGGAGGGEPGGSPNAAGNTPPTSPSQGSNGGRGGAVSPDAGSGGGGGLMGCGVNAGGSAGGPGGAGGGIPNAFGCNGTPSGGFRFYAAGAGAGNHGDYTAGNAGTGGTGFGAGAPGPAGNPSPTSAAKAGAANTGHGGGGAGAGGGHPFSSGGGGKGIVVIRYKFQN